MRGRVAIVGIAAVLALPAAAQARPKHHHNPHHATKHHARHHVKVHKADAEGSDEPWRSELVNCHEAAWEGEVVEACEQANTPGPFEAEVDEAEVEVLATGEFTTS